MRNVVLGVTGSVAAIRVPALFASLVAKGLHVRVVATEPALYFFNPDELGAASGEATGPGPVYRDSDEWPEGRYERDDPILHIEFRKWADLLVVAPLDANTLAKFALGLADNFLTCLFRAWDYSRPVILAPAMNTMMWHSPVTARHLGQILADRAGLAAPPQDWSLESASDYFAKLAPGTILVPPQSKRLACGDVGMGAMAEVHSIVEIVGEWADRGREPS